LQGRKVTKTDTRTEGNKPTARLLQLAYINFHHIKMSTGNSFAFTGILVMLACFAVANHAIVRNVRAYTDKRARAGEPAPNRAPFGLDCIRNRVLASFSSRRHDNKSSVCVTTLIGFIKHMFGWFMAFLFDIVQRTELGTDEFWLWRELPCSCGRWSTAVLLIVTSFILSDNFLVSVDDRQCFRVHGIFFRRRLNVCLLCT